MAVYEKSSHIEISLKDGKKAVFHNTETGKDWQCAKKPIVEIAALFKKNPQRTDSQIAKQLNISEAEAIKRLKPLIKKGYISELKEEEILFD